MIDFGESAIMGDAREFSIDWLRSGGNSQLVRGADDTGSFQAFNLTPRFLEVHKSSLDCFPDYPMEKDYNKTAKPLLPFTLFIETGTPNCGMTLELVSFSILNSNALYLMLMFLYGSRTEF